jgi:hypothetical protein
MLSYFEDTDRIGSAFHLLDGVRRYRTSFGPHTKQVAVFREHDNHWI